MKKLLIFLIPILLLISFAQALDWGMPSSVSQNNNFDILINGNGLYGLELNIPSTFTIISDPSNGILTNGTYRTSYASTLKITLRGNQVGDYTFLGQYSEGSGVKQLTTKTISIVRSSSIPVCSACISDSEFSSCVNNKKVRTIYFCNASTNYVCQSQVISENCISSNLTSIDNNLCEKGYTFNQDKNECIKNNKTLIWIIVISLIAIIAIIILMVIKWRK